MCALLRLEGATAHSLCGEPAFKPHTTRSVVLLIRFPINSSPCLVFPLLSYAALGIPGLVL